MVDDHPGLATDLAILRLGGSHVEQRDGHRVVRTPDNPLFHWGNFLIVDPGPPGAEPDVEDAPSWLATFAREFPGASYVAISLPRLPTGPAWSQAGVPIELDDVLVARAAPPPVPLAVGYRAVRLAGDDLGWWEGLRRLSLGELEAHRPRDEVNEPFTHAKVAARRALVASGTGSSFVALDESGEVAAALGIVTCGDRARYQDVITAPAHRRRGLARHLLTAAADWAGAQGCRAWVIVAAADGPAGRIYRRAGFAPAARAVSAYRP